MKNQDAEKSRRFILKQKLLRRAWDGESRLAASGAEMILLIQMRLAQCRAAPAHEDILEELRLLDADAPRGVRMLNAMARHSDAPVRYSAAEECGTLH